MHVNAGVLDTNAQTTAFRGFLTPWRAAMLLAALVGLLVLLWPLGLAGDYMNHLARNHIESQIWFDPNLQKNYTLAFEFIPDLAMDMVVPWLAHVIGIYAAGALMIWLAFVMPPLAGLFIARKLYGRVSWIALLGFLAMFNRNMEWGFVNFEVSIGIALTAFAFWIGSPPSWRRTLAFAPFSVFLVFNHALGFLLFGYLVLLWEIGCFAAGERGSLRDFLRQLASKDALAMIPGLVVLFLATSGTEDLARDTLIEFWLAPKIKAIWSGSAFFVPALARIVAVAVIGVFWLGLRRGILKMDPRMMWVCGGLLALVIAMPTAIFGIWGLHFRYPAVLLILAAASVQILPGHDRVVKLAAAGAAALLAAVYVNASMQMSRIDRFADANRQLLAAVPDGARVLPARDEQTSPLLTLHATAIAVIERAAFVPNLFTNTSPVGVRPEIRPLHMPQSWPLLAEELAASAALELPETDNGYWSKDYFHGWPRHWDYVLYYRSDPAHSLSQPFLCRAAETAGAVLYKVSGGECTGKADAAS